MLCPACQSHHIVKNGLNALKKQIHRCQDCGRQFVLNPAKGPISDETKKRIDQLLLERIPLAGIARAMEVSESWLQNYVNQKYDAVPQEVDVTGKPKGRLTIECDELWSFVEKKITNNGFGLQSIATQRKSWVFLLVTEVLNLHGAYGNRYLVFIDNAL
jgi:transposase-like protein